MRGHKYIWHFVLASVLQFTGLNSFGSHIAGGEFRMRHLEEFTYQLDLVIFFDIVNGAPGAQDPDVKVSIFRSSDNAFIEDVLLLLTEIVELPTIEGCQPNSPRIRKLVYTRAQPLSPDIYNDPQGYYISWERCCRNYILTNIFSENPAVSSNYAGQTFIMEFPPVIKNGQPIVNSSPVFPTPKMDYACVGREYKMDFNATDPDGDQLVYSFVTPLSTHTSSPLAPNPMPKPYPDVNWRNSFSLLNFMAGSTAPHFTFNNWIEVVPTIQGVFAFAVKCEEYRQGMKIGEVRREYYLTALDCPQSTAPSLSARPLDGTYTNLPFEVYFDNSVENESRCIQVSISDEDVNVDLSESVRLDLIPIGWEGDATRYLPEVSEVKLTPDNATAEFLVCFDPCSPASTNSFQLALVGLDDSCGFPRSDTLQVKITIDGPIDGCLEQSINFTAIQNVLLTDTPFDLDAEASSGLPVEFESSDPSIASIVGSGVTLHKAGVVEFVARQEGNEIYRPAAPVVQQICVLPPPPVLSIKGVSTYFELESSVEFGNLWYKNELYQSHLFRDSLLVYNGDGDVYSVRRLENGCLSDESNRIAIDFSTQPVVTGLGQRDGLVQIYPIPVVDLLHLEFGIHKFYQIQVISLTGQVIYENCVASKSIDVNLSSEPAGIYLLRVTADDLVYKYKVLKYK